MAAAARYNDNLHNDPFLGGQAFDAVDQHDWHLSRIVAQFLLNGAHQHQAIINQTPDALQIYDAVPPQVSLMRPDADVGLSLQHLLFRSLRYYRHGYELVSPQTIAHALIYINRLIGHDYLVLEGDLYGVLCAALLLAAKNHFDVNHSMADFAIVFQVHSQTLCRAEAFLAEALDYGLYVDHVEYHNVAIYINNLADEPYGPIHDQNIDNTNNNNNNNDHDLPPEGQQLIV
eukprot:TRINITY_DN5287_c0_g1_i1.p1 TRINITY_DN5287_c0_g1~~TRINITY_DN5287_c0_g1_i1.p1  ORF type:complete len:231 (+),score=50.79 TRINITY_DN5287_c0_g1_i1:226-918(+)